MNITLLAATCYSDPTYHRVLSSLAREYSAAGHEARVFSWPAPASGPGLALRKSHPEPASLLAAPPPPGSVLHFHFSGRPLPKHAPLLLHPRLAGLRLALTFQDYLHPDLPPPGAAQRRVLRALLARARSVTAVSGFLAGLLRRDFPAFARRIKVVPNGADRPSGRAAEGGYILSVGREVPYKGLDLLLFAYARAADLGCRAPLTICGAGPGGPLEKLALRLGLGGRVRLRGVVSPAELARLTRGCLFFATLPRWESFGMAALEAMAAGKGVLAAAAGGLPEFCRGAALLSPPGDTEAAARALLRLAGDAGLRGRLGGKAARKAAAYTWRAAAAGYLRAFR